LIKVAVSAITLDLAGFDRLLSFQTRGLRAKLLGEEK